MAIGKKVVVVLGVAGAGLYFANENGLLDGLLPEDDPYDEYDDEDEDWEKDMNINNPYALFAIGLATQLGLKAVGKAVKKITTSKVSTKAQIKTNVGVAPSAPKAVGKPPPVSTKPVSVAPPKVNANVITDVVPSKPPPVSGVKPGTVASNATLAKPPPPPSTVPPKAAASAAKSGKASTMMSKLKGTPADLIVMVIAQILMAVLDLDPESFKACETGEFDLNKLPDWAQAMIGAIPFLGDLFDLIGNKMCLRAGCPKDAPDESAGLCYKPCNPGFKSDGAIMCYKQYPEFEGNGMLHTLTSITKKILLDTGKIPTRCGDDEEKNGGFCYEKVDGYTNVAGTVWQNCPGGFTDTGIRCEKLHDVGAGRIPGLNPCPAGEHDDGVSCWRTVGQVCGDDCSKGWDGCRRRGLFGECWGGCRESCSPVRVISRTAFDRGQYTAPHEDKIDGLNYNKCPEGMSHQPGMPYLCTASFTKQSRVLAPRLLKCDRRSKPGVAAGQVDWEEDTNIAGLCYSQVPPGYTRKVIGTLDQNCPPGAGDFGVGCTRESYNRGAGLIPLGIRFKDRV